MKAKVKATGQIVTLDSRCNVTEVVKGGHPRMWTLAELELEDNPDYWTRLEHQAAIAAMQAIVTNCGSHDYASELDELLVTPCIEIAHALVEKMKEEK